MGWKRRAIVTVAVVVSVLAVHLSGRQADPTRLGDAHMNTLTQVNPAPATPTGVQVISAPDLRAQVAILCSELFRNRNAGILFMAPPGVRDTDRICFQGSDLETLSCKTVGQIKADWNIK